MALFVMHNILRQPLPVAELTSILAANAGTPLLPPLGSPRWKAAFAQPLAADWLASIRPVAAAEAGRPLPELSDGLYADFARTGTRLNFERVYFERRRQLARAAILALADGEGGDAASLVAKIRGIFEEESWALPAHTGAPSGKDPLCIDLFCAETANLMAELLVLFEAVLPSELAAAIRARLRENVFEIFLTREFVWTNITNNWNAVCHQGVVGAALGAEPDQELVARVLERAAANLPDFLSGFTADGGSSEGPGYWVYGFGWFCDLNRQLEMRSGGELSLVHGDPHVDRIARFGARNQLSNGYAVAFSDGHAKTRLTPWLLQYVAQRFHDPLSGQWAQANYAAQTGAGFAVHGQRTDLMFLTRQLLQLPPEMARETVAEPADGDSYFPDLAVAVTRGRDQRGHLWELAAKAGHNGEHHNHNDCGSYQLHVDGEPFLIEVGAPEYDRDFFSDKRYLNLAARSLGHSVPLINGTEQASGWEFNSAIRTCEITPQIVQLTIDLTAAYPPAAQCKSCVRTLTLDRAAGELIVADSFVLSAAVPVETALMTGAEVDLVPEGWLLRHHGVELLVKWGHGTIGEMQRLSYTNHHGEETVVSRLALASPPSERVTLSYSIALHR